MWRSLCNIGFEPSRASCCASMLAARSLSLHVCTRRHYHIIMQAGVRNITHAGCPRGPPGVNNQKKTPGVCGCSVPACPRSSAARRYSQAHDTQRWIDMAGRGRTVSPPSSRARVGVCWCVRGLPGLPHQSVNTCVYGTFGSRFDDGRHCIYAAGWFLPPGINHSHSSLGGHLVRMGVYIKRGPP